MIVSGWVVIAHVKTPCGVVFRFFSASHTFTRKRSESSHSNQVEEMTSYSVSQLEINFSQDTQTDRRTHTDPCTFKQEIPPAWMQEAYCPPCSKYSLCCSVSQGNTYPGRDYLPWTGGSYPAWGYQPWMEGLLPCLRVPTLDRGGSTYLGRGVAIHGRYHFIGWKIGACPHISWKVGTPCHLEGRYPLITWKVGTPISWKDQVKLLAPQFFPLMSQHRKADLITHRCGMDLPHMPSCWPVSAVI